MASWIFEHVGAEGGDEVSSTSSSATSSIGKNSDWWSSESSSEEEEEEEVQSAYNAKQGFLDALEEALPIKKGLSEFYIGRSKSYACMDDAACLSSVKVIGKAENKYNRRHRNLLAFDFLSKESVNGGPISKKPASRKLMSGLSKCLSITRSNCSDSSLRSRVSSNNLVSLKLEYITVPRKSISLPDFGLLQRSPNNSLSLFSPKLNNNRKNNLG